MADDPNKRGPQDRGRINLSERHEVRYWTKELGVSEDMLRETVGQFGNRVGAVREAISHFKTGHRKPAKAARASTTKR